jgi:hypothetical protein
MRYSAGITFANSPAVGVVFAALISGCTGASTTVARRDNAEVPTASSAGDNRASDKTAARNDEASAAEAAASPVAAIAPVPTVLETSAAPAVAEPAVAGATVVREAAKPVVGEYAKGVPPVLLSSGHSKFAKVNVGDVLPRIELPQLDGGAASLDSLAGAKATVVLIWTADRWMSATALTDLARLAPAEGVAIVGIGVGLSADAARGILKKTGAKFPQLLDGQGAALAAVGQDSLPRVYVLDGQRRIELFYI